MPVEIQEEEISDMDVRPRTSVDLSAENTKLITDFAAYRNALAAAQGRRLRKQWSRKSMSEHLLTIQCDALRAQLAELFKELGSLPDAENKEAVLAYARKVVAREERLAKKEKQSK